VLGPGDYRDSAWFNRTRHVDELFVPSSCCLEASEQRAKSVAKPRVCQLDAILLPDPGNMIPVTALKTRVDDSFVSRTDKDKERTKDIAASAVVTDNKYESIN